MSLDNGRKMHLELLRVLAVYLVILTHTGKRGYTLFTTLEPSFEYFLAMLVPIICNIAVPLFYMISGATLMGKDEIPEYVLKRRLPRYLWVLILASALMYVYYGIAHRGELSIRDFFQTIYSRNVIVPYWFLYSYIGFLLLLPFLRRLIRGLTDREWHYLLMLYVIFKGVVPILQYWLFRGSLTLNTSFNITMVTGDILIYPALGYYLEQRCMSVKKLGLLWLCAFAAVFVTAYMTHYKIVQTGQVDEGQVGTFYKSLCIFPAAAVFASAKKLARMPKWIEKIVFAMGGCTFGVYLIEQILREQGYPLCDRLRQFMPPLTATFIYTAVVSMVSMGIVWLLKLIPGVHKLI